MTAKRLIRSTIFLVILIVCGAAFRLVLLGDASLQMDNIIFWDLFSRDVSSTVIFLQWMQLTGQTGQLPLVPAAAKLFLDIFHLPLTFFTMILPFALLGVLTIPVAYMAGREFGGKRLALILAAIVAFNPLCVQMSREAYFYAPTFFGTFLALWAVGLSGRFWRGEPVPGYFHVVNAAAFFIMTWSSPSAWPFAFFFVLFNIAVFGWQAFRLHRGYRGLILILTTYFVIGLPLLIAPWGLTQIRLFTSDGQTRDFWTQVFATGRAHSSWTKIWPVFSAYAWGKTPFRQLFSLLVLCSGLWFYITGFRKNKTFSVMGCVFLAVLVLNVMAVEKSVWIFGITRVVPLVPFFLLFLSCGLIAPFERTKSRVAAITQLSLTLFAFMLWVPALVQIPKLNGLSRPYAAVASWADNQLPPGTLVLTERYFTAYNEFRVHAPQRVQFVSTVPNQIPDLYHQFRFREQTLSLFEEYPASAFYLEKHLWERTETGPWPEVLELFSRKHSITNTAFMALSELGLYYRGDPSAPFNLDRFVSTVYYNLPEDVLQRGRRETQAVLRLYGEGWRYLKPWQPMQGWPEQLMQMLWIQAGMYGDGRKTVASRNDLQQIPQAQAMQYLNQGRWADYRIPGAKSPLRLFNLTEQDLQATLTVTGIALSGNVRCMIGADVFVFPQTLMVERQIPLTLKPGENEVVVAVPNNQFILVHDVRLHADQDNTP